MASNSILTKMASFFTRNQPSGANPGNIVPQPTNTIPVPNVLPPTQKQVMAIEPFGYSTPSHRIGRISGYGQVQNLSQDLTIQKVQAAFRSAERGDTRFLFTYYRDLFLGTGPIAAETQKRKLSIISQPYKILPIDKNDQDDVLAAEVIQDMIETCPSWRTSLIHLMNAIVYPVAVAEKIMPPYDESKHGPNKYNLRYKFETLSPVDYQLLCYRLPYLPSGPLNPTSLPIYPSPSGIQSTTGRPQSTIFDPDSFEPWLRFWSVLPNGLPIFDFSSIYEADPMRHFVYRCNLFSGMAPDNFGGLGRALLFWAIMSQLGKEYWLRYVDQFGSPFIIAKVDTAQSDTVAFLTEQFQLAQRQHALIVNKDADINLAEAATSAASEGHQKFMQFINDQISILISGQTLSTSAKSTGLGSGVANLQSQVRQDIIDYDRQSLGDALRTQLFDQYLKVNGFTGCAPKIIFGGTPPAESKLLAETIASLANGGIVPSVDSMEHISERLGFQVEKREIQTMNSGSFNNEKSNENPEETEKKDGETNIDKESE